MDREKIFELANERDADACYAVGDMYYYGDDVQKDISKAIEYYNIAADTGHVEAKYSLGYIYRFGEGVKKDISRAIKLLEYAAERNHAKSNRYLGFLYFWGDDIAVDYEKSFSYLLRAADLGDADAQAHVAQSYEGEMWGAPKGYCELAQEYYQLALEQNNDHAQWCIGHNYHGGFNGYPQDYQKAFMYFKMAAENGSNKAQLNLALCYANGEGTPVNMAESKKWLEIATKNGNSEAAGRLGMLLLSGIDLLTPFTKENTKRGYALLKEAVASGDHVATDFLEDFEKTISSWGATLDTWTITMLGCEQESKGNGVRAVNYYKEAANQNCAQAMAFLGSIYLSGVGGVAKDPALSAQWLKKGAQAGNASAQCSLGISYLQGAGVPHNVIEAEKWLRLSAEKGNTGAKLCLADLYADDPTTYFKAENLYKEIICASDLPEQNMNDAKCSLGILYGRQEKFNLAVPLLREAAHANNEIAQYMLGCCYYDGCGAPRNIEEAIRWWKKAATNGSTDAREQLQQVTPGIQTYQQKQQNKQSTGCYVATAVYGSYDCPAVWTLRRFRDYELAQTLLGCAFIRIYYAISPVAVKWFGKTSWFVNFCKPILDRIVAALNQKGVEDTPYSDRPWY